MKRFLIMSIALISLIAMGSPAMADRGVRPNEPGNSAAGRDSLGFGSDPNCRGARASLFVLVCGGLGTGNKATNKTDDEMTELIAFFFGLGAESSDCIDLRSVPDCPE